jgi:signal transduction histidine kinase/ActR/RegA family two-component response regulator
VVLFRDVTVERRAQEALRGSEKRQAFLLELNDALRPLASIEEIEATTNRLLGMHLGVDRVMFSEVVGEPGAEEGLIRSQYVRPAAQGQPSTVPFAERVDYRRFFGKSTMAGRYRGDLLVVADIDASPGFEASERAAWAAAGVRAAIIVPLAKSSKLVDELGVQCAAPRVWTEAEISLVREVAERTWVAGERAHSTKALKESEQTLRTADERKNEFIATLAHELRNPLAPMRTGLSILNRTGGASATAVRTREVMDRQLTYLVRLVDDLLDVSRVSRGEVVLKKTVNTLQGVVDLALETSRPLLDTAGHHLRVDLPREPVLLNVDATRISQVLSNILNNAAKYTPNGGQVSLRAERVAPDRVRLQVEDTGMGIPPEMLDNVFDLFTQVDHASGRSQGGLGIGLSLSRRLVELHGGTVRARSAGLGQGSTFTVELPAMPALAQESPPQDGASNTASGVAGKSVLVVDDNVDAAEMLLMALQFDGHEVRVVHTGNDALAAFAEGEAPDVVLLDIGLPDRSGYEVAEALRQRRAFDRTVLVALTGWGARRDQARTQAAGFDLHLTKPVSSEALAKALASGPRRGAQPLA